eukprot:CAMPEP_0174308958 /NCGR_PEP_ID=MMETSP0810-20121108/2089_1 /TAXON_ID=73025 ORGANISM="Eutreptiella gymnastica-like, Strain CCMP1594" /NCGR_SAMPLE_ID=MMETSP0810 /ASSEMBLY_ACC=CAM_ASM_000659 /LENGTH=119 /DNA_ID=CAMNT_0015416429 /DNA_START=514 /DNA_END=871 /DNA_ORIENTATION=+
MSFNEQLPQQPIAAFNNPSKRDLQTAGRNTQQEPILLRKIELHCPPATATETVLLSILHHDTALRLGGEAWQGGPEMRRNSPHAKDTSAQNASAIMWSEALAGNPDDQAPPKGRWRPAE